MTKSESSGPPETKSFRENSSRQSTKLTSTSRIDAPHESGCPFLESPTAGQTPAAEPLAAEPAGEQIRLQADQLAAHLRSRQKELDYREAELNSRIARLESEARAARLWLDEREIEWASRSEELAKQQQEMLLGRQEMEKRLTRLAAAEAAQQKHAPVSSVQQDEELRRTAEALATRKKQLDEAEVRLAEETATTRERMAAEQQQAMADLEQKRQAVQRRADHVDQCRTALTQLRAELGRMHRETLEIRLATEELWVQLSGAAPPAALTRSLGRIRTKLAEQYAQANAELADQKKELEAIRGQLVQQHETLVGQKRRFDRWAATCREECEQQASRLVARERQLSTTSG